MTFARLRPFSATAAVIPGQGTQAILNNQRWRICATCSARKDTLHTFAEVRRLLDRVAVEGDGGTLIGGASLHAAFCKPENLDAVKRLLLLPWVVNKHHPGTSFSVLSLFLSLETDRTKTAAWFECLATADYNQYTIESGTTTIGTAIFPSASFVNHSCRPNVAMIRMRDASGVRMRVMPLRALAKGEELTTDYVDNGVLFDDSRTHMFYAASSTTVRQYLLANKYHFVCTCAKCKLCWKCNKKQNSRWTCAKCGGGWCSANCKKTELGPHDHNTLCELLAHATQALLHAQCISPQHWAGVSETQVDPQTDAGQSPTFCRSLPTGLFVLPPKRCSAPRSSTHSIDASS